MQLRYYIFKGDTFITHLQNSVAPVICALLVLDIIHTVIPNHNRISKVLNIV